MEGTSCENAYYPTQESSQQSQKRIEREDDEDARVLEEPVNQKTASKRSRGKMLKTEDEDEEDRGARWKDDEIEMLIALRADMDDDFKKNRKKQGVDMWHKLHARLLSQIPTMKKSHVAVKKKFNNLFRAYKEIKLANNVSGESRHECKYYDQFESRFSQAGSVQKHVSASANDLDLPVENCVDEMDLDDSLDSTKKKTSTTRASGGNPQSSRRPKASPSTVTMSGGVFETSKTPAESSSVQVTLLRCKSTGRVLFLEAGKDFVDTLISFLTLPLGTVIKLILSEGNQTARIGGISNIFGSVEKLSKSLLHVDRTTVTNPRPSSAFQQTLLHVDAGVDQKPVTKYYPCISRQNCRNIFPDATDQCPSCSQKYPGTNYGLNAREPLNVVSSATAQKTVPKKGYVKKNLTYIVTDDLELLPTSTIKCIDVMNKMSVENMADLESKEITISHTQVLQLLQAALTTSSCLNQVFGEK